MAAKMRIRILWNRLPEALGESFSKMCHAAPRSALDVRATAKPALGEIDRLFGLI
jgi:hypothetical protein